MIGSLTLIVNKFPKSNLFKAEIEGSNLALRNANVTLSADNIGEAAIYNWYNTSKELVGSGESLSVTAASTEKYTLEVIATADGYKDYDSVVVATSLGRIESVSPNPANAHVTVAYSLSGEIASASIKVQNVAGQIFYSAPLNTSVNLHVIDLQAIPAGQYTVRIECAGNVQDTKTLIVN
ncbi:MAG: T9SS type A sorting domain-containing protein [Bacteroidales bacterium]|nr:T9SS type A sorting domain-containing protein [Bacteroidales bacterium]